MDYKELSENEIFVINEELLKKLGSSKKEKKPYGFFSEDFLAEYSENKEKITYS